MTRSKLSKAVQLAHVLGCVVLIVGGCASTPKNDPGVPSPEVSSDQIEYSVRRPVPVYEHTPEQKSLDDGANTEASRPPQVTSTIIGNRSTSRSQTVVALLDQATTQERAGNPERAAAVLERALRIEPKNARLWHRLALIRYQQGQFLLAESLAAKSSALAQDDWQLKQENLDLIQQVRQQRVR